MVTPTRPVQVGPFNLGVNNRLPDTELAVPKVGTFLREAVNVNITTAGTVKRRQGSAVSVPGTDCHSFWSNGKFAYFVDGTSLYALTGSPSGLTKTLLRSGLTPGMRLSYTELNGQVIYSDGLVLRRLVGNTEKPFGVPKLGASPDVSVGASGALVAGSYQVCFTYVGADLQQSGSTNPVRLDVAAGQGIAITGLPAAFPPDVASLAVFMTSPNGDKLQLAQLLAAPQPTLAINTPPRLGARCQTVQSDAIPPGNIVRQNNGRLLVAAESFLYYSDPFAPALMQSLNNFIPFDTPITVVESVKSGTYVATTDKTYYFAGDIAQAEAQRLLPYGGIAGTGGTSPDELRCWWMSARGMVRSTEGGGVENLQEKNIAMSRANVGASLYHEDDGVKKLVTSLFGKESTGAVAYSFMDAEIIRKGVVV